MYVCNCNGINRCKVREAIATGGAVEARDIFRYHGVRPQCGKCIWEMREMIDAVAADRPDPASPLPVHGRRINNE